MPDLGAYQLQRIGRTGRQKDGHIAVLVAEGEEANFDKARESYSRVTQVIQRGDMIDLYTDAPRLLPLGHHPQPKEMVMPIVSYGQPITDTESSKVKSAEPSAEKTQARNDSKLQLDPQKRMKTRSAKAPSSYTGTAEAMGNKRTRADGTDGWASRLRSTKKRRLADEA